MRLDNGKDVLRLRPVPQKMLKSGSRYAGGNVPEDPILLRNVFLLYL